MGMYVDVAVVALVIVQQDGVACGLAHSNTKVERLASSAPISLRISSIKWLP